MSVSRPVTSQTTSNQPGAPTCRAMIEETMKMPEPIIDPATSMVESSKPRPRTNFSSAGGGEIIARELIIFRPDCATSKQCGFKNEFENVKPLSREANHAILRRVKILARCLSPTTLSILLAAFFAASEICVAAPKGERISDSSSPRFEALPLTRSGQNHLLVRAFINGKPALLGVDSGAPISAIALQRRAHFGLTGIPGSSTLPARLQINGAFNNVAIAHNFRLGALTLVDEPVVVVDLSGSGRASRLLHEPEIDGIVGADILFPTGAVLDCQKQMLILKLDPESSGKTTGMQYRGFSSMTVRVSETYNLYVAESIHRAPYRWMNDNVQYDTMLNRGFLRRLHVPLQETPFSSSAVN